MNLPAERVRKDLRVPPTGTAPAPVEQASGGWRAGMAAVLQLGLVVAILALAFAAHRMIVASAPVAERGTGERLARLVETTPALAAAAGPVAEAWGAVRAAQTLIVRPEIAGRLDWVHPEVTPGGLLRAGEVAARLDPRDLELAVLQAEADIADIQARIAIERGQAAVGERELGRLGRQLTEEQEALVRREPQMAQLDAELAAAEATLEQARNALARTEVRVPFDALVISEEVAPGVMLMQSTVAATVVAADRFHVVLPVPATALAWIDVAGGQPVTLSQPGIWPAGAVRQGRVVRLGAQLSETGRMAELIVEVEDPLAIAAAAGQPALLLGSFVAGHLEGPPIPGAVALDRAHLRDGDTVWVVDGEDRLEIRAVEIAWRGPDSVLVTAGLAPGERIVTTRLATFAPGMALRTAEPEA